MLTPGVKLRPQEVPPLCLPSATWIVRPLTVWLLLPQQVLEQVPMVLLEQFHVSKQCVVININAEFTMLLSACHFINQPTHLPVSLCSYVDLYCFPTCYYSLSPLLYQAINLFVCLPFFSLPLVFVSVSAICIYIHMCHTKYNCSHTFLSALLTCVSFCKMSSVSGITSVDTFFLCSSSENYFPGHFARCTARLLNLDCKYC